MAEEPLSAQIARLRQATDAQAQQRQRDARYSRTGRMRADLARSGTFAAQVLAGARWVWQWAIRPPLHWSNIASRWLLWKYRVLWSYSVYRRNPDKRLVFSATRAGLFLIATFVFVWYILLSLVECLWDGGIYLATARVHEHVYLLGSQEIDSWTGAHVIEGCSRLPCSDEDAIYFRTHGGLFNNLWSVFHGKGLFYPEYVGAAVPYSTSKCVITSYGVRVRFPFRLVNTYSYLLAVTCSPVDAIHN